MVPTFVLKVVSRVPSEFNRLTNPETEIVPPTTSIFPSDWTPIPATVLLIDEAAFALNEVSEVPSALNRRRYPVKSPPTRIFPSDCTAVARDVFPKDDPTLVEYSEISEVVSTAWASCVDPNGFGDTANVAAMREVARTVRTNWRMAGLSGRRDVNIIYISLFTIGVSHLSKINRPDKRNFF